MTGATLDDWLSKMYQADIRLKNVEVIESFKIALGSDTVLKEAAQERLNELETMIKTRGESACAYSTKYRNYLQKALS